MILGGKILDEIFASGRWVAKHKGETYKPKAGPNSIDVTLSNRFWTLETGQGTIDPTVEMAEYFEETVEAYILQPHKFCLSVVNESFDCSAPVHGKYYVPMYEGRSTLGRLGLGSHVTAGFGDYGFSAPFTVELFNIGSVGLLLRPNIRIGQVYFVQCEQPYKYTGAYVNGGTVPVTGAGRL